MKIRLSNNVIFEWLNDDFSRDLDIDPKLHLYQFPSSNKEFFHFIQGDTGNPVNTREYQWSNRINNIWLNPTPVFYPEEEIQGNFHQDSELSNLLSDVTLPVMDYRKGRLLFTQGYGYTNSFRGITFRIYLIANNKTVVLTSLYDLADASNIIPASPVEFESQIFNTQIPIEVVDISYILNNDQEPKIQQLKNIIFGSEIPESLYFEYSDLNNESIDQVIVGGNTYTQFNRESVNSVFQSLETESLGLFALIQKQENFLTLSINHPNFDPETYLNKFKEPLETYQVTHQVQVDQYDNLNNLIDTDILTFYNPVSTFSPIQYRPIVLPNTDHFNVGLTITITNLNTGLKFSYFTSLIVTDPTNYLPEQSGVVFNLTEDKVYNRITRNVNQITPTSDTPNVVTVTEKVYLQIQELSQLDLLDADQTVLLTIQPNITGKRTYLKIGNLQFPNNPNSLLSFDIPKKVYNLQNDKFVLLDENFKTITSGNINRV